MGKNRNERNTQKTSLTASPIRFSAAYLLRLRHGLTQKRASALAGITQADICEIERYRPYGRLAKYQKLAKAYRVPVEALAKNDLRAIPEGAMALPTLEYTPPANSELALLGRDGEEFALRMEQERLKHSWPALKELVFPYYKVHCQSPGFDILSIDDNGLPFALEVKTSWDDDGTFMLTPNEYATAKTLTAENIPYVVRLITNWGLDNQSVRDISFAELQKGYKITPQNYKVAPKTPRDELITGLTYYRQVRELTQAKLAEMLNINQYELSLYETGVRQPSVDFYIKASEILEVTIDQLLERYEQ